MELKKMICPACGANITFPLGARTAKCEYCDTQVYVEGDFKQTTNEYTYGKAAASARPNIQYREEIVEDADPEKVEAFKKKVRIWIIILGVSLAIGVGFDGTGLSEALGGLFGTVLVFGGIYLLMAKPKKTKRNNELPWPLRTGWIVMLGFFTGGIYWVLGPVFRYLRNKQ